MTRSARLIAAFCRLADAAQRETDWFLTWQPTGHTLEEYNTERYIRQLRFNRIQFAQARVISLLRQS